MNAKIPQPIAMLIAPLLLISIFVISHSSFAAERPNIIFILADDVGWGDAGCYGATQVKTPHIDRLAREGQRFENGHASAAVCTPTRYSMITGQYSWRNNAEGLNKGVAKGDAPLLIPTTMTTAPGPLKQASYLDKLASQGMTFTDAHSGSSVCTPTRYGVLTGRCAWRTRLQNGVLDGYVAPLIATDRLTAPGFL